MENYIQELNSIDRKAEEMAGLVLKNPLLRIDLEKTSDILEQRLLFLADELEKSDPTAYRMYSHQISEALLDLVFVQIDTDSVSFRLGQVIEQQRLNDEDNFTVKGKVKPTAGLDITTRKDGNKTLNH